jgi:hypothetical protein
MKSAKGECRGKEAFSDFANATRVAKKGRRRYNDPMVAYHCKGCGQWHVGSDLDSKARKKKLTRARSSGGTVQVGADVGDQDTEEPA